MMTKTSMAFAGSAFLILGATFVWCVSRMLQSNRTDILVSAPLAPVQELRLPATGMARLILEVPRTSLEYRNLRIDLTETQTGRNVTASYSVAAAQGAVYGVTTMQVPFGPAVMVEAGVFIARISGLREGNDYSRYRLILSRPYLGRLTLQIILLVLCFVGMLLDAIWVAWMAGWMKTASSGGV